MSLVIAHEGIERRELHGRRDVDGVQRAERWLVERPSRQQKGPVKREQADRIEGLAGSGHQDVEGQSWVTGRRSSDGTWHLSEHKLTRNEIGVRKEFP